MFIKEVIARKIKDSRGEKTIEVRVKTLKGVFIASAPFGKSIGRHETPAYNSKGINWSINLLEQLGKILKNKNIMIKTFEEFEKFENYIKKFQEKFGKIGANGTYALEAAMLKAIAHENKKQLWEFLLYYDGKTRKAKMPMPIGNCIGGGLHSSNKRKPDFQEFLLIANENAFSKAVTKNFQAYEKAKKLLKKKQKAWIMTRNDEGAWQTKLPEEEALKIMKDVAEQYKLKIGIDVAASTFFEKSKLDYLYQKNWIRTREDQIYFIARLIKQYNLFYVEDPLYEEDFSGFAELNKGKHLLVGDDLTATNLERIKKALQRNSINAVIIKPNQNGYLYEVFKIINFCKQNKLKIIVSHRSGETMDNSLADIAVGFQADYIKAGIYGRSRLIKLRRVMEIEKQINYQ